MTIRCDANSLVAGKIVCGALGRGVLGSTILLTTGAGEHGAGVLYNDVQAGDEGKEFRAFVAAPPAGLVMDEDGTFSYTGPATSFSYTGYADGVSFGAATVTLSVPGEQLLASALAATATLVAGLRVGKPLAAGLSASSAMGATLSVTPLVTLAAPLSAAATLSAALKVAKPLALALPAAATLTAALQAAKPLSAPLAASATFTAALQVGSQVDLWLALGVSSALQAALQVGKPLAASFGATVTLAADLQVLPAPTATALAAALACNTTFTAALTVGAPQRAFSSELRTVRVYSDAAGLLGKFGKQPGEVLDYGFDFTPWLQDCGDAIDMPAVYSNAPGELQVLEVWRTDGTVAALAAGGTDGKVYKLTCTATTVGGRTKEADIQVRIKES